MADDRVDPEQRAASGDPGAPGWEAITDALDLVHPGVAPMHWGTAVRYSAGGTDPLDGVSAYLVRGGPGGAGPHWHYVSYGLSDLYAKTTDDPVRSGHGFEITFRLAATDDADGAPLWPANLLQSVARYVVATGRSISGGHHIDLREPLTSDVSTALTALLFVADPELGEIATAFGSVRFVQLVGITADELDAAKRWNVEGMAVLLQSRDPLFVTDPARVSMLTDPSVSDAVRAGILRDGSSTDVLLLPEGGAEIGLEGLRIIISASGVENFVVVLPGRLRFGHTLSLASKAGDLPVLFQLQPRSPQDDEVGHWVASSEIVEVWLTDRGLAQLVDGLTPTPGVQSFPEVPDTTFEVV